MAQRLPKLPEDSWFNDWMAYWPLAEPPKSFMLFCGFAMLGIMLGRRLWFPKGGLKGFPIINLILLGRSGIGKSTAIRLGFQMLRRAYAPAELPALIQDEVTPQGLHAALMCNNHAIVVAEELALLFGRQKYQEGMLPYMTDLLDYKDAKNRLLKGANPSARRPEEMIVKEPTVAILGGSTKEWLQDQMPDSAMTGGFLPRFLILKEDHKGQKIAHPDSMLGRKAKEELDTFQSRTAWAFRRMVGAAPQGEMGFADYSVADRYGEWYMAHEPAMAALEPFAARAGEMVIRLAMLLAVSRERQAIEEQDIEAAVALYAYAESRLAEAVEPYTPTGRLQKAVLDAVGRQSVAPWLLVRRLRSQMTAADVHKFVASLIEAKELEQVEGKYRRPLKELAV